MHVGSVLLFEGPAPDYDDFVARIAGGLHLVPRYRQRLAFPPFGASRPLWVDDPHFNAGYHVRHTALPAPAGEDELRRLAGRVFSQQLDREKPLWEIWLVDEVADDRFALICKTHHALVDGISGVDIMTVLFDLDRDPPAKRGAAGRGPRGRCRGARSCWPPRSASAWSRRSGSCAGCSSSPDRAGAGSGALRGGARGDGRRGRLGRAAEPAERADRAAPALRVGVRRPGDVQGDQGRAGRHDQRRRADRRHRRAARAPVPPRA